MEYEEYNDNELIMQIHEQSEEAKDILFEKYKYIINIEIKKYLKIANILGYDYNDLYQDALVGFINGINNYNQDKESSLPTFITMCVDRTLQNSIRRINNKKSKVQAESLSLEYVYEPMSSPLRELISDNSENDPLVNIIKNEEYSELNKSIKETLSKNEYKVYQYMIKGLKYNDIALLLNKEPKQIDNTIQRIKNKIKKVIE